MSVLSQLFQCKSKMNRGPKSRKHEHHRRQMCSLAPLLWLINRTAMMMMVVVIERGGRRIPTVPASICNHSLGRLTANKIHTGISFPAAHTHAAQVKSCQGASVFRSLDLYCRSFWIDYCTRTVVFIFQQPRHPPSPSLFTNS